MCVLCVCVCHSVCMACTLLDWRKSLFMEITFQSHTPKKRRKKRWTETFRTRVENVQTLLPLFRWLPFPYARFVGSVNRFNYSRLKPIFIVSSRQMYKTNMSRYKCITTVQLLFFSLFAPTSAFLFSLTLFKYFCCHFLAHSLFSIFPSRSCSFSLSGAL